MTTWQPMTLRQPGQAWPGMDTRAGFLDNGTGLLEQGSKNVQIHRSDTLEKRPGFVRGIEEWFGAVVCGLFTYQDYCGNEFLLVATEDEIAIRQPFQLPQFTASDAYPNDQFEGLAAFIDDTTWRNSGRYIIAAESMVQADGAAFSSGSRLAPELFMRWFKDAGAFAYRVSIDYSFDAGLAATQRVGTVIRGNDDLTQGGLLQADVVFNPAGTYEVRIFHREADGTVRAAPPILLDGQPRGSMTFLYTEDLSVGGFRPIVEVLPALGLFKRGFGPTLNTVQDVDLGLVSAIAIGQDAGTITREIEIPIVTGGPVQSGVDIGG